MKIDKFNTLKFYFKKLQIDKPLSASFLKGRKHKLKNNK